MFEDPDDDELIEEPPPLEDDDDYWNKSLIHTPEPLQPETFLNNLLIKC
jgi:hypothetical protein